MNTPAIPNDQELLASMLAGDDEALTVLYRRRQGNVYRFALHMCGSRALAEDITQEVFLTLISDGRAFDPGRGSLNAFLLGVTRNLILRRLRRERFYVSFEERSDEALTPNQTLSGTEEPLDDLSRNEAIDAVRKAVLSLPERYREVVVLCELQELSYAETAEILGCAIGTVRSRLHRARRLLLAKLRPDLEEDESSATVKSARCFA